MNLGVREVGVERLAGRLRALHEVDRPVGDLAIEPDAELGVVDGDRLRLLALLLRVDRLGLERDLGLPVYGAAVTGPFGK